MLRALHRLVTSPCGPSQRLPAYEPVIESTHIQRYVTANIPGETTGRREKSNLLGSKQHQLRSGTLLLENVRYCRTEAPPDHCHERGVSALRRRRLLVGGCYSPYQRLLAEVVQ